MNRELPWQQLLHCASPAETEWFFPFAQCQAKGKAALSPVSSSLRGSPAAFVLGPAGGVSVLAQSTGLRPIPIF